MSKPTPRRNAAAALALLVVFSLGMMLAVFVAGSASAASTTKKKTTTTKTTTAKKTTTAHTTTTTDTTAALPSYTTTTPSSPGDSFFVINGTVNAASDHEIVGSSAFPNFTTGAVDNYYSMAHSHVDNSPFAEGTASPADTGPVGQTAAAGNFQQPQYADARWPGDKASGNASYGTKGQPYAEAAAAEYQATANASEAENGLSGPGLGGKKTLALPKGFGLRLRQALAAWKTKWQGPLGLKKPALPKRPAVTTPVATVTVPKVPVPPVTVPKPKVTPPTATVTTPVATVTVPTPHPISSGGAAPAPSVTVPSVTLPSAGADGASRSLASRQTTQSASASSPPADGESLLKASTQATLVRGPDKPCKNDTTTTATTTTAAKGKTKTPAPKTDTTKSTTCKTYALVTSGESSLGRVSLGGGQIVIEGIHVNASISNDGTPTYKANVSIASATIGGVPVTIDQDGVHVAGQGQGLPYQQASDALNGALKQAGIQLFLVGPEVTTNSCGDQSGSGTGGGTTTTSSDQSGSSSSCDQTGSMCDQSGAGTGGGTGTGPGLPAPTTTSSDQSGTTSSCGQTGSMCDQSGTGTGSGSGSTGTTTNSTTPSRGQSGTTTTTSSSSCDQSGAMCDQSGAGNGSGGTGSGGIPGIGSTTTTTSKNQSGTTTTTSSKDQSGSTTTTSSCGGTGLPSTTGSCSASGSASGTSPTANGQTDTTTTMSSGDQFGLGAGSSNSGAETVTATGLHVVFTQPVNQPGVPSQFVEHILGEVFVDSLAVPASSGPNFDLSSSFGSSSFSGSGSSSFSGSSSSSGCGGGAHGAASGASASGGGSSTGGAGLAGSGSGSGTAYGASSQPGSGSTGSSLPAMFAAALRKPLWLLLAYVLWQAIVIGTGASLWNWRRGGAS